MTTKTTTNFGANNFGIKGHDHVLPGDKLTKYGKERVDKSRNYGSLNAADESKGQESRKSEIVAH